MGRSARRIDDDDAEYGLEEEEDEQDALIELAGAGRRRRPPASTYDPLAAPPPGGGGSGATCRWAAVLFLLALAGVYRLGLREGKHEARGADGAADAAARPNHALGGDADEVQVKGAPKPLGEGAPERAPAPAAFTLARLEAVRTECERLTSLLEGYYTNKAQASAMLLGSWVGAWDFATGAEGAAGEARVRADKLVDTMARALVTDDQTKFVIGGIGSSVMAGHDNCHYDSYGSQFERLWQPVWNAAGMDFEFQNAGEGGACMDSFRNQHFCAQQNVAPDVDVLHYSWTYFEGRGGGPEHEDLARWLQMLPRQPPLHIFNTGVRKRPDRDDPLVGPYAAYGFNTFYMQTGFENGGHDYAAEKRNGTDRFGRGFVGDGYHDVTRYGEALAVDDARRESLGVVMRNWHPGPMGFQLVSDAFTYLYTNAVLRALDLIEKDLAAGRDPRATWSAGERPLLMASDLPEPVLCDPEYCVVNEAPSCTNYEYPTFGSWGARVEDPRDELNPYGAEAVGRWTPWKKPSGWMQKVGKQTERIFKDREDKEMCRHLDACGGLSAQKASDGTVVFRLPKMEVGLVVICMCCWGKGGGMARKMFFENFFENIEISYNTVPVERASMDIWPDPKCVRVNKRFPTSGRESQTPTGHAYLAIKIVNDMNKTVHISHVITL